MVVNRSALNLCEMLSWQDYQETNRRKACRRPQQKLKSNTNNWPQSSYTKKTGLGNNCE